MKTYAAMIVIFFLCSITPSYAATGIDTNQVVYLHYDYMVAADHSHKPDPLAIQIVVDAFKAHGVKLKIDATHNAIPEKKVVTLVPVDTACAGSDAVWIEDLRAQYLHQHSNHDWHYCVFAHQVTTPDFTHAFQCPRNNGHVPDPTANGIAELPGDDFIVAMGTLIDNGEPVTLSFEAAIFMHELGHNLGLRHGGDVDDNFKPNYISIMNYAYELNGIVQAPAAGSTDINSCSSGCLPGTYCHPDVLGLGFDYCFRVDYSSQKLPALNEFSPNVGIAGLDENVGVSGPSSDVDLVFYHNDNGSELIGASNGSPIDWNSNGIIETHVKADINYDRLYTLLTGFDDWSYVHSVLSAQNADFTARQSPQSQQSHQIIYEPGFTNLRERSIWSKLSPHKTTRAIPATFSLHQNFPNPFNPTTTIRYDLPRRTHVILEVYDLLGQKIAALVNESQDAGEQSVQFDAGKMPSGVYFYRLQAGTLFETRKLVLMK